MIAQPVSVASLSQLVRFLCKKKIAIVPRGNGTSGWGGALPTKGGACIDLRMMNDILDFDEYRLSVTVEAGITWRKLLMFLESIGLTLPVYPSSAASATVGGFVASNGLGIGSAHFGEICNNVLGMEVVLPNGLVVRVGNVVITSNDNDRTIAAEGTDWFDKVLEEIHFSKHVNPIRIFCGTYGTMGIITKVTLRVVPKLIHRSFACSFDSLKPMINAMVEIQEKSNPYNIRFIMDSYSEKLAALSSHQDEYGKFIISGALMDTLDNVDNALDELLKIIEKYNGTILDEERSAYYWNERFFPLRIKKLGPSLVPSEILIDIRKIPELYEEVLHKIPRAHLAVEGQMGKATLGSFLAWILDDERRKLTYTLGWHRSFDIASLAMKKGGRPYSVALWNAYLAENYYGKAWFDELRQVKKRIDPNNIMNPLKVFGGRVSAKKESLLFGFITPFITVLSLSVLLPLLLNWHWLLQLLWSSEYLISPGLAIAILAGVAGYAFIYLMSFQLAIRLGVSILRIGDRVIRRMATGL